MKKLTIIALFAALGFASCKDTKAEATTTETTTTTTTAEEAVDSHAGHDHGAEPTTTATSGEAPADGINPAHGQPGHRCDIAVGAPLNSAPAKPAANAAPAQPAGGDGFLGGANAAPAQAAPQQQAMPAQQTAPGMQGKPNPAHGQPGHRCDIQVGQPLP